MCGEEVFNKWFKPAEDWFLIILLRKNACMYVYYVLHVGSAQSIQLFKKSS